VSRAHNGLQCRARKLGRSCKGNAQRGHDANPRKT
jgi:hypothetical protein